MPIAKAHYFHQRISLDPSVDQIPNPLRIFIFRLSANLQFSSSKPSAIHAYTPQHFNNDVDIVISAFVLIVLFWLILEASTYLFKRFGVDLLTADKIVYRAFAVTAEESLPLEVQIASLVHLSIYQKNKYTATLHCNTHLKGHSWSLLYF